MRNKEYMAQFAVDPVERDKRYSLDEPWTWGDTAIVAAIGIVVAGIVAAISALRSYGMGVL